jgi:hypothetical protein
MEEVFIQQEKVGMDGLMQAGKEAYPVLPDSLQWSGKKQ